MSQWEFRAGRGSDRRRCAPACINASRWDCTLEPTGGRYLTVRLGFRMVAGLSNDDGARIVAHRGEVPYTGVEELWRRACVPASALERLADEALPLFVAADRGQAPQPELVEPPVALARMTDGGEVVEDYRSVGLSLRRHPVAFLRDDLSRRGMIGCGDLARTRDGRRVKVSGIVLVRQRPGSASGVLFITIEDETGVANLIVWPSVFERHRRLILAATMLPATAGCSARARSSTSSRTVWRTCPTCCTAWAAATQMCRSALAAAMRRATVSAWIHACRGVADQGFPACGGTVASKCRRGISGNAAPRNQRREREVPDNSLDGHVRGHATTGISPVQSDRRFRHVARPLRAELGRGSRCGHQTEHTSSVPSTGNRTAKPQPMTWRSNSVLGTGPSTNSISQKTTRSSLSAGETDRRQ